MSTIKNAWSSMPKWARWLIGIFVAIAVIRAIADPTPSTTAPKPSTATSQAQKTAGQRALGSSLTGWTQASDGRILVTFDAWSMTRDSVEGDVRKIMRELTSERRSDWTSITISAYGTSTDAYGKKSQVVVYTIEFSRSEAEKVVDWDRADIIKVGLRSFAVPQLQ
jgi:hypothetical protein